MNRNKISRIAVQGTMAAVLGAGLAGACMASSAGASASGHDHQTFTQASKDFTVSPSRKEY